MHVMEPKRSKVRFLAILGIGAILCVAAFGYRMLGGRNPVGDWHGYAYDKIDGKFVPDPMYGDFALILRKDGTYVETDNQTSGKWTQERGEINLHPTKFFGLTAEESRKRYMKGGKENVAIKRLFEKHTRPMVVRFHTWQDRLILEDGSLHLEFTRK